MLPVFAQIYERPYRSLQAIDSRICYKVVGSPEPVKDILAFSEVSASGLSTSASTLPSIVGSWEFTNATELQVSKQKQQLHPVFPPMCWGMATAKKDIQKVSLERIQPSSNWVYMKWLELNKLPLTFKIQLMCTKDASTVTRSPMSTLTCRISLRALGKDRVKETKRLRQKWHSPSLQTISHQHSSPPLLHHTYFHHIF